ncbi:MAG: UvrD-helicase domain-containing protein, partial [Halobaculum sp.]
MSDRGSFPALERLKRETEGVNALIEAAPPLVGQGLSWLFEIEYLERKSEVLAERDRIRERFVNGRKRIESTYGTVVTRALRRRADGNPPRLDPARLEAELDDARAAIRELSRDLDEEYLTRAERRELASLTSDIVDAREYARTKRAFDETRPEIAAEIEAFDERFEPYADGEQYMTTSDETYLIEQSRVVWGRVTDLARELRLHVLPDEDADWLAERKTRFSELVDTLPAYNEQYVAREREQYADLFETAHGPLNERQQRAVVRDDRRNLVDASAGTGKTLTLTYRFLYLLKKGVPVDEIAAITYTSDAAEEMKRRIAGAADVRESDLNIATIHSFALSLYGETTTGDGEISLGAVRETLIETFFEGATADLSAAEVGTDYPEQYATFREAFAEFRRIDADREYVADHKPHGTDWESFVRGKFGEFVGKARTFDRSPSEITATVDGSNPLQAAFATAGAALVAAYEDRVAATERPLDFDDMVASATRVVREYPEEFASRYSHVLVDEFQDVSESTLRFVESFLDRGSETHLFAVGDDWQSIFGFTGSNVRLFTEYEERFADVTYTQLAINYRCPPAVVDAGTELMANSDAPQNEKRVRAHSEVESTPELHTLSGLYDARVATYIADRVERALDEGYDYDEVMVLSRNDEGSDYMRDLRRELADRDVPHRRPGRDYLPEEYVDGLSEPVEYEGGDATFADGPDEGTRVPMVLTQSIHASKGTEAPVVFLLHAADDEPDGIPIDQRTDDLIAPATAITADHVPEERRLFYVALTRTEDRFVAVAPDGRVSRYLDDIADHVTRVERTVSEVVGKCTWFESDPDRGPVRGFLQCNGASVKVVAWPNEHPPT